MSSVEDKAINQADKHFNQFMDDCTWPEMLEQFADYSNRYGKIRNELLDRKERGARLDDADFADYFYYQRYLDQLSRVIAGNALVAEGYERDKKGKWILKNQPAPSQSPRPAKKKFGFWG